MGLIDRAAAGLGIDSGLFEDIKETAGDVVDLFGGRDAVKAEEEPISTAPGIGLALQSSDRDLVPGVLAIRSTAGRMSHAIVFGRAIPIMMFGGAVVLAVWQRKRIETVLGLRNKKTRQAALLILAAVIGFRIYRARNSSR